ncbi:MAG: hypothetical protein COW30_01715 [Rhodospirillales bacterium CG15_BIG_FIL_POST_REV_8_21_14_020_66_15]|nr:MAG: hypothetical protein COW30_01715 [Rhodospirillales bacterium CG15_BIG_FIL_POST_REV_8_21_14_020_66_15]
MKKPVILTACLVAGLLAAVPSAGAGELKGRACVIDGETLMLGGKRRHTKCEGGKIVKLWGIAAFKLNQTCEHGMGRTVMCGRYSAAMLQEKIKTAEIRCDEKATTFGGIIVAECFLGDDNINQHMVENGYALANRKDTERYTGYEARAKAGNKGMWTTRFTPPWDYIGR